MRVRRFLPRVPNVSTLRRAETTTVVRSLHWHRGLADQRRESLPLHGTAGHLRVIPSTGLRHPQRDGIESHGTPGQAAECCYQLATATLRALILQSTFTSLDTFASHYWAPAFLLRDHFDNLAAVRSFPGPVLVIHGQI